MPLIEAGLTDSEAAREAAQRYLHRIQEADADTVILGCTHYPFLISTLSSIAPQLNFIDPAERTVARLQQLVAGAGGAPLTAATDHVLYTTGDKAVFAAQVERFLPGLHDRYRVETARWEDEVLWLG